MQLAGHSRCYSNPGLLISPLMFIFSLVLAYFILYRIEGVAMNWSAQSLLFILSYLLLQSPILVTSFPPSSRFSRAFYFLIFTTFTLSQKNSALLTMLLSEVSIFGHILKTLWFPSPQALFEMTYLSLGSSLMLTGRLPMFLKANSIPLDLFTMNIITDPFGSKVFRFKQGCAGVCLWPLTCFGSHYFVGWNLCNALCVRSPCQRKVRGASVAPAVCREVPSIQKLPWLCALKVKSAKKYWLYCVVKGMDGIREMALEQIS